MIAPSALVSPFYKQGVSGKLWDRNCASSQPYEASERFLDFSFKILSSSGARAHLPLKATLIGVEVKFRMLTLF